MIVLFGNKRIVTPLGMTKPYTCGRCHNVNPWQVIKVSTWFTLFFIPVFPYSTHYDEKCPVCGGWNELSKEEAMAYAAGTHQ